MKKTRVRAKRAQPAADPRQLEAFDEDPILFLGESEEPKRSFHVKPNPSLAGQAKEESLRALENNAVVAENLLDVIEALCQDGTLHLAAWQPSIDALKKMSMGNGST